MRKIKNEENNVATLSSIRKNELKQNKFNITQYNTI